MKRVWFVIVLAALLVATTGAARARATRIEFTGMTACDPDSVTLIREWPAGPNYQGRGFTQICYDDIASTPQMLGIEYISFKVQQVGPNFILSGTDRMETYEGGVWVGSWVLPAHSDTLRIIMRGEGKYPGQQLRMFENVITNEFWGYIEDTGD
jgi:hypothetical protein